MWGDVMCGCVVAYLALWFAVHFGAYYNSPYCMYQVPISLDKYQMTSLPPVFHSCWRMLGQANAFSKLLIPGVCACSAYFYLACQYGISLKLGYKVTKINLCSYLIFFLKFTFRKKAYNFGQLKKNNVLIITAQLHALRRPPLIPVKDMMIGS